MALYKCCIIIIIIIIIGGAAFDDSREFLPRDAMLARYLTSSCVRLSVISQCSTKMAKPRITQTTTYDGTIDQGLVFLCQDLGEIPMGLPPTGAPTRGGVG